MKILGHISWLFIFLVQDVISVTCKPKSETTSYGEHDCCGDKYGEFNYIVLYVGCSVGGIILIVAAIICIYTCAKTSFKPSWILSPSSIAKKLDLPPNYSPSPPEGHVKCYSIPPVPPSYTERNLPPPPYSG